ncbi:membrane steroid-binding protein 2-like isoform X2 [Carex rostrata]
MEIYSFLSETIHAYTGLSLAAFFTILSLMIGAYFLVSSFFVHPDSVAVTEKSAVATTTPSAEQPPSPPPALLAQPVQMGEMTLEELKVYNGSDRNKPLLVSIKGDVYNVSRGWLFYGPGGAYHFFSGNEISRALALMSFDPNDFTDNLDGLGPNEMEVLNDWEEKFKEKYVKVGHVVRRRENDTSEPESLTNDVANVGADADE